MRRSIAVFLALGLLAAQPARAAPTCQDRDGATIRCGVPGAMPVGWTLPEAERAAPPQPRFSETFLMVEAIFTVVLLLALFATMPEFDGRTDADWDRQEGDDRR